MRELIAVSMVLAFAVSTGTIALCDGPRGERDAFN